MSNIIVLYGYNTYFNRTIKKLSTYNDYKNFAIANSLPYIELANANFDVADGVYAKHTINAAKNTPAYNKNPNYLVAEDPEGNISRWFVLEATKTAGGQYVLSLKRDVIADYSDLIKTAPAYIQKGSLNFESPLIFNKEGMQFNEIKKKEILLKDKSKSSWIVGYIARSEEMPESKECKGKSDNVPGSFIDYDDLPNNIKTAITLGGQISIFNNFDIDMLLYQETVYASQKFTYKYLLTSNGNEIGSFSLVQSYSSSNAGNIKVANSITPGSYTNHIKSCFDVSDFNDVILAEGSTRISMDVFEQYNGKVISRNGKTYRLVFASGHPLTVNKRIHQSDLLSTDYGRTLNSFYSRVIQNSDYSIISKSSDTTLSLLRIYLTSTTVRLVEEDLTDVKVTIVTKNTTNPLLVRNQLHDSPYDMFCIPMGDNMTFETSTGTVNVVGNVALAIARAIKLSLETFVYDIQILPYCPFVQALDDEDNENIDLTRLVEHKDYEFITNEADEKISVLLYPITSKGSIDIDVSDVEEFALSEDSVERKIAAETIKARLVSPNYSGSFDFNPQKNNGVSIINVDYNYKPYTPYIHVSPVFSGLYGEDFNDARGLICGGDFSISVASSKWEEYQIQNKNFENIFSRQIENMDVNNSIAMEKEKYTAVISGITNTISTGAGGAIAGSQFNLGISGGILGGVVGGALSTVGALKDIELLGRQQSENRDYAVDMYTYNLQNIQALPYTLSKVSTFNENNKVFPFIEIYDCTDVEKQNLRDKIKYNGMTVMIQGKIEDYVLSEGDYIQAKLIRIEEFDDDSHVLTEIYDELMKGVFIYAW